MCVKGLGTMPQDSRRDYAEHSSDLQHQSAHDQTRVGQRSTSKERVVGSFPAQIQSQECEQTQEAEGHQQEERVHAIPARAAGEQARQANREW